MNMRLLLALAIIVSTAAPRAQPAATSAGVTVVEEAGLRRTEYPVRALVPLPKGAIRDQQHARLRLNEMEAPAQYAVSATWPDGSVQLLAVRFNVSLAPGESRSYTLQYGDGVKPELTPRGLTVTEDAESIQVGTVRFSKSGAPLLLSANYRAEFIDRGVDAQNGIAVTDHSGTRLDISRAQSRTVEILERGPLAVVLRFAGRFALEGGVSTPFTLTIEMPNSKSWVKMTAVVDDPGRRVRDLAIETPFAFGPYPWVWDVATENGTYGAFRTAADSVAFTQTVDPRGAKAWRVETGPAGNLRPYEASTTPRGAEGTRNHVALGWGHFQGANTAVAFALEDFGRRPGTYALLMNGAGQTSFRFTPAEAAPQLRLTVYQHFVGTPVAIGAATSPASILRPPTVLVDPAQYKRSGVPVPQAVR